MHKTPTIEKNIPMPARSRVGPRGKWVQLLKQMEVGDSFTARKRAHYGGAIRAAKQLGIKLAQRQQEDGFRVWRVK